MEQQQTELPGAQQVEQQAVPQTARRTAVRSPLLFPVYHFGEARRIAEKVETMGAGKMDEATLAIALGMSVKSSGFLLRALTARQFKLLQKNGAMLETTQLAKAIFKPVNATEQLNAMKESFLSVPLFNAVAARFKGQPFPQGDVFRNILERELRIPHDRVSAAERVLLDSAREAKVLTVSGTNTYLAADMTGQGTTPEPQVIEQQKGSEDRQVKVNKDEQDSDKTKRQGSPSSGELLTISAVDLAEFEPKEFDEVWGAIGKIVMKRGKRLLEQENKK